MSTFVIVHGAFGGGWEWTRVARILRDQGHDVWTPTLTGLGDRAHLAHRGVGLSTHIRDVLALLELEDLRRVVLCGASYGGMPVTGAADGAPERVAGVVYVDALVPRDGQSALDLLPASFRASVAARSRSRARGAWNVPVPLQVLPPRGGIPDERWSHYVSRLVPQPAATFSDAIRLTGAVDGLPRGFVRCTGSNLENDPIERIATRIRKRRWPYREIEAPHDPHLFDPLGTARIILRLSRELRGRQPRGPRSA